MTHTNSYHIYGNKIYYPSSNNSSIQNHLDDQDRKDSTIFKPQSYGFTKTFANFPFGTDFTNLSTKPKVTFSYGISRLQ
jgi:hypothetical protein